jgi:hypothetical protein
LKTGASEQIEEIHCFYGQRRFAVFTGMIKEKQTKFEFFKICFVPNELKLRVRYELLLSMPDFFATRTYLESFAHAFLRISDTTTIAYDRMALNIGNAEIFRKFPHPIHSGPPEASGMRNAFFYRPARVSHTRYDANRGGPEFTIITATSYY